MTIFAIDNLKYLPRKDFVNNLALLAPFREGSLGTLLFLPESFENFDQATIHGG